MLSNMNPEKNNFGLPEVDNTPTGLLNMQGDMLRGMTDNSKERSLFVRILTIFFSLVILLIPGLLLAWFGVEWYLNEGQRVGVAMNISGVIPSVIAILMIIGGIYGIMVNLRKGKISK